MPEPLAGYVSALRKKCAELKKERDSYMLLSKMRPRPFADTDAGLVAQVAELQRQLKDHEEVHADHRRLVRELDVILNGEEGAAKQASLCDIVAQMREAAKQDEDEFKPKFVKFRNDQCGCKYAEYELQLTSCGGEFEGDAPKLYALPPNLPALIEQAKREEREAALKPLRTAVMALASAATSNPMFACDPMYQGAYEEIDAAIRARTKSDPVYQAAYEEFDEDIPATGSEEGKSNGNI